MRDDYDVTLTASADTVLASDCRALFARAITRRGIQRLCDSARGLLQRGFAQSGLLVAIVSQNHLIFIRDGAGVHNNFVRKKCSFATKTSG